MRFSLSDQ